MATQAQTQRRKYYTKKRTKILKRMRQYYKNNRADRKRYQKAYYKRTKRLGGPLYLKDKKNGQRPLFPRVTAHNRRNGRFAKGKKGTPGRKPARSGMAFKPRTAKRRAA